MDDLGLLRRYVQERSEEAFAQVVRRHVDWVYAAAARQMRDPALAEDVTQAVFIVLARKAEAVLGLKVLSGWLFRTCQYCCANALKRERIRRQHEQKAAAMRSERIEEEAGWNEIAPMLDAAVGGLGEADRQALLLRYYEGRSVKEVGEALGVSEGVMQKRLSRAIQKLRRLLGQRGVKVSATTLAVLLVGQMVQAAPAHLASAATAAALSSAAAGAGTAIAQGALGLMLWTKVKVAAVLLLCLLGAAGVLVVATGGEGEAPGTGEPPAVAQSGPVLEFPPDRSLGELWMQDQSLPPALAERGKWDFLAEARGNVGVPPGKRLMLRLSAQGWSDLAPLGKLGADALHRLVFLPPPARERPADDRAMVHLAHLSGLKALDVSEANLSARGLRVLRSLKGLNYLYLPPRVDDAAMAQVAQMAGLKGVYVKYAPGGVRLKCRAYGPVGLTAASLSLLAELEGLEELAVGGPMLHDEGLIHLGRMKSLKWLMLWGPNLSEAALANIKDLAGLDHLILQAPGLTDVGLARIGQIKGLKGLSIAGNLTAGGLKGLEALEGLESLEIRSPQPIPDEALRALKAKLPKLTSTRAAAWEAASEK